MKRITKNILISIMIVICIVCILFTIKEIKETNDSVTITINTEENLTEQDDGKQYEQPEDAIGQPAPIKPTVDNKPGSDPCSPSTCEMRADETPAENSNIVNTGEVKTNINYLLIIINLIMATLITYFIMSKFNLHSFKKIYSKKLNIVLTIAIIFCSTILLYTCENYYLLEKYEKTEGNLQKIDGDFSSHNLITSSANIEGVQYITDQYKQNALLINKAKDVVFNNIRVYKTGGLKSIDHGVEGFNSAVLALNYSKVTIKNSKIVSAAKGANGIHSNFGSTIDVYDTEISTNDFGSGGIMSTIESKVNAYNLNITTNGNSSAAIRTDSSNGIINVDGGTYTTNGIGSPTIYSTGVVQVKNAKLISNVSEGVVIDGANSITIENTTLDSNNTKLNGDAKLYSNVMLYNTAIKNNKDSSKGAFTAKNSEIITQKGNTIYVLNQGAIVTLENNKIINKDSEGNFLYAMSEETKEKKSKVMILLSNQTIEGNSVVDSDSSLEMTLYESQYIGKINNKNESKNITITLDKESTLTLTGDSYIKSLKNDDKTNSNIKLNGYKLYINGKKLK